MGQQLPTTSLNQGYYNPYMNLAQGSYSGANTGSPQLAGQAGQIDTSPLMNQAGLNQRMNQRMSQTAATKPVNPMGQAGGGFNNQALTTGISALGGLADTLSQKSTDPMDFSVDKWAGYAGSAKGFASGGPWGAIIGGSLAQLGTFNKVHENMRNLNTGVTGIQYDSLGRPMYNSTGVVNAQENLDALRKGVKAINTSVDPATHLISFVRGTERQLQRKRRRLTEGIRAGQQSFNTAANDMNQQQAAMSQYKDLMNRGNRMRSLYNIGNPTLY